MSRGTEVTGVFRTGLRRSTAQRINQRHLNHVSKLHLDSAFYDAASVLAGKTSLAPFEIEDLGPLTGRRVLHLQCGIGLDSISLARLGAEVVGVDFAHTAILSARKL